MTRTRTAPMPNGSTNTSALSSSAPSTPRGSKSRKSVKPSKKPPPGLPTQEELEQATAARRLRKQISLYTIVGMHHRLQGKQFHPDYDLWSDEQQNNYEKGRLIAAEEPEFAQFLIEQWSKK